MLIDESLWRETATLTRQHTNAQGEYLSVETVSRRPLEEVAVLLSLMDDHDGMHVDLPERLVSPLGFAGAGINDLIIAHKARLKRVWG